MNYEQAVFRIPELKGLVKHSAANRCDSRNLDQFLSVLRDDNRFIGQGYSKQAAYQRAVDKAIAHAVAKDWIEDPNKAPTLLSFSDALELLKQGHKVARSGWNGKGMYVVAQAQTTKTQAENIWNPHNKAHAETLGGQIDVAPYCTLKTAQDTLAMGWIPSTGDLFANDWVQL